MVEFEKTFASCTDPGHLHSTSMKKPLLSHTAWTLQGKELFVVEVIL